MYHVVRSTSRFLYLAPPSGDRDRDELQENTKNDFPRLINSWKTLLKRKFFGVDDRERDTEAESSFMKRRKVNYDSEEAIQLALINPQECVFLIQHHALQVLELKDEFTILKKNVCEIFDGVTKSRLLKLGNVRTAFILLQPDSSTEHSSCNFDLNFIFYEGEAVRLKTMTCTTGGEFLENNPTLETEPFKLPEGSCYSLENPHSSQKVLLRIFWIEKEK